MRTGSYELPSEAAAPKAEKTCRWTAGILSFPRWAQQLCGVTVLLAVWASLITLGVLPGAEQVSAGEWHAIFRYWRWNEESEATESSEISMPHVFPASQEMGSSPWTAAPAFPLPNVDHGQRLLGETGQSGNGTSSSSQAGNGCGGSHGVEHSLEGTLAFLMTCFVLCCALEHLNLMVPSFCRLPISVVMFLVGKAVGTFSLNVFGGGDHLGKGFDVLIEGLQGAAWFDPHALLYVILPPLLYESAASMSWRVLRKVLPSSMLLAVPGVLLNTMLTGLYVKGVVRVQGEAPAWQTAWLLSSILSATDPVAVVAALAALGAPQKLSALIEGESLLNDGTAVVATYVLRDWVMGAGAPASEKFCTGSPPATTCIIQYFVQVAFGGCLVGFAAGILLAYWVTHVRSHYHTVLEISIILTAVYSTFFLAEALATSGVLAVVSLGFMMSAHIHHRMSHEGRHNHHVVLAQISYACNQVAFLAAGIISARFLWGGTGCHGDHTVSHGYAWLELAGLYVTIHMTRAAVIAVFLPLLRRLGYGITWKESAILVYGGLRGAVGLVMSLIVEHSEYIDAPISQMVAFHTSGIVLATLLINGLSIQYVYRGLDIYPANPFRRTYLRKILAKLEAECQKGDIRQISRDWFFWDVLLAKILRGVPNFKFIQFCEAGTPVPAGILEMHGVLKSVEHSANVHMQDAIMTDPNAFEAPFGGRWDKLKAQREQDFATRFSSLLDECTKITLDRKDHLVRGVIALEDKKLGYRLETCAGHGLYVSMRSLQTLAEDPLSGKADRISRVPVDDDSDSSDEEMCAFEFEVEITRFMKAVHVVVGLMSSPSRIQPPCPPEVPHSEEKMILGYTSGTVAIDSFTGKVMMSMSRATSEIVSPVAFDSEADAEDSDRPPFVRQVSPKAQEVHECTAMMEDQCECGNIFMDDAIFCRKCGARRRQKANYSLESGTVIQTKYMPILGSKDWEVTFTARSAEGSVLMRKRLPLGRHAPAQLYPAIEFTRSQSSSAKYQPRPSQGIGLKATITRGFSAVAGLDAKSKMNRESKLSHMGRPHLGEHDKAEKRRKNELQIFDHTKNGGGAPMKIEPDTSRCGSFQEEPEVGSKPRSSNIGAWEVHVQAPEDKGDGSLSYAVSYDVGQTPVESVESPFLIADTQNDFPSKDEERTVLPFCKPANQDDGISDEQKSPDSNSGVEEVLVSMPKHLPAEVLHSSNGLSSKDADAGLSSEDADTVGALTGHGQAAGKSLPLSMPLSGRPSIDSSDSRDSGISQKTVDMAEDHVAAAVMLSFELQLATGSDSINELFIVLFNTVRRRYCEMHENGVLGDLAFGWLNESVGEALDCSHREVNSLGASDFRKGATLTNIAGGGAPTAKKNYLDQLTRMWSGETTSRSSQNSMSESRRKSSRIVSGVAGDPEKNPLRRKFADLFEPMLVEYMSIEKRVSQPSIWDRLPGKWERFRQYGYPVTAAKVEAMWAFVLAHEHVVKECPSLDRFPAMQLCIVRVIEEVKSDLTLLEELQPRRSFYSKHLLALRVTMKRRLEKLHRFADEGWLNAADSEALVEILQERLTETDHYFPHLHTRAVHALATSDKRPSIDASAAWKELEAPGFDHHMPTDRSSGHFEGRAHSGRASIKQFFRASTQNSTTDGGMFSGGHGGLSTGLFAFRRRSSGGGGNVNTGTPVVPASNEKPATKFLPRRMSAAAAGRRRTSMFA